jgi:flagellar protein FliO/FliZ
MTTGVDVADLSSVVMSLALVVAFIFVAAYVLRRTPFGAAARRAGPLKIVASLPLGPKERLLLVQARDAELLIGVSPAGVFNLGAQGSERAAASARAVPAEPAQDQAPVFALGDAS